MYQFIALRIGFADAEGLAAHAARASWLASREWEDPAYQQWLSDPKFSIRATNANVFRTLSQNGWRGSKVAVASPLLSPSQAPTSIRKASSFWQPWGTVPEPKASVSVVLPGPAKPHDLCVQAALALHHEPRYRGERVTVGYAYPTVTFN